MLRFVLLYLLSEAAFSSPFDFAMVKKKLAEQVDHYQLPAKIHLQDYEVKLHYSLDSSLENYISKLLMRYRSDFSSVVVLDNNTGKILAALDYKKKEKEKIGRNLAFSATHPAASLFKVITAAELLQNAGVDLDSRFHYHGSSTTLYKYQLRPRLTRWSRSLDFKKAFALSNNVVFGKAAIDYIKSKSIYKMAENFGFNQNLLGELDTDRSKLYFPETQYHLAELASGFNRETLISPLHGSLFPSIVVNDGQLIKPRLVERFEVNQDGGSKTWSMDRVAKTVIDPSVSKELREMMSYTVRHGTARSAFRQYLRRGGRHLEIGGKTGSITGGEPHGKRDWFTAYALPKGQNQDKGISVCIMNINLKKWYVKSAVLAQKIIEYYYEEKIKNQI